MRTAVQKTQEALRLAKELGGKNALNCIAEIDPTALVQAAELDRLPANERGALNGLPVLIKDNIDVCGLHTTAGSLALADNIALRDAPVIANLRRNGAVILGKTNMTEFANYTTQGMPGGYSSRGGYVIHAADASLSPSGSSSGSAVAVAADIVPAAVGTDTSFSIIACAQDNGICGLKPPAGALAPDGVIPIARTLDSVGAMAKELRTALALYSAMRDEPLPVIEPAPVRGLRIGVNTANLPMVSEEQRSFLEKTVAALRTQGAEVGEILQEYAPQQKVIMQWEFKPHLEDYLRNASTARKTLAEIVAFYEAHPRKMMKYGITLLLQSLYETPGGLLSEPYRNAMAIRDARRKQATQQLAPFDAVIMTGPTNIMHFCGMPSVCIAGRQKNRYGFSRCLILYGADEHRLYRAALAAEALLP